MIIFTIDVASPDILIRIGENVITQDQFQERHDEI
jgi:hypothetical protein